MKKLATASFALLASTIAASAHAQYNANPYGTTQHNSPYAANTQHKPHNDNWPNWYVGVSGGINFHSSDINGALNGDIKDGWSGTLSLGFRPYATGSGFDNFRFELAATYAAADADISGVETHAISPMFNVYYDMRREGFVRPYIGAGIGATRLQYEDHNQYFVGNLQEPNPFYNPLTPGSERMQDVLDSTGNPIPVYNRGGKDSDIAFSYQFMAGLTLVPENLHNVEFLMGYRYQRSGDLDYSLSGLGNFESQYRNHSLEAGARFRF